MNTTPTTLEEAVAKIAALERQVHDLNWALGTEGYDTLSDPQDQADHDAAVRGTELFVQRMAQAAARQQALETDAARYQLLRRGQKWSVIDGGGNELRADVLDAAIDAARSA